MALLACSECGNQVSTSAAACPACGAPVAASAAAAEPTAAGAPSAPAKKGMSKGCMTALGCGACLFVGVVMVGGGAGLYGFQHYRTEQRRAEIMKQLDQEMEQERLAEEESAHAKAKDSARISEQRNYDLSDYATPAPTATAEEVVGHGGGIGGGIGGLGVSEPRRAMEAATPVRTVATPKPAPVQHLAMAVATPRPVAPSHTSMGGLKLSGTKASTSRSLSVSGHKTVAVAASVSAKPAATALPWEDSSDTVPAAIAANSTVKTAAPVVEKSAPVAVAAVAATPAVVVPKPTPTPDPNARVIHSQNGEKPVELNKNIALTGSDGKTVVGVLVQVKDGFVDVRVSGQLLRIAERDVLDAAAY